ncbi:MAG TPA: HEAT repeat domain-containing protein [Armatimonadota bacterium]|nr:HEAT repeat domain-containing protein [Armatimonadota bacterium]HPP73628.1 HEAT repeat domain-containing protein [Armatimonadota bacterium]
MWPFRPNIEAMARKRNVKGLIKVLQGRNEPDRLKAAEALGHLGMVESLEVLVQALEDSSPAIREAVSTAIRYVIETNITSMAVSDLVMTGQPALPALLQVVANPEADEESRVKSAKALGQIGDNSAASSLIDALRYCDGLVAAAVIDTLGQLGDPGAVVVIANVLGADDASPDKVVHNAARHALEQLGEGMYALAIDAALAGDSSKLLEIGIEKARGPMVRALCSGPGERREAAAKVLRELGDSSVVQRFTQDLTNNNPARRKRAAEALGRLCDVGSVEPLINCLRDQDAGVRAAASWAINRLGQDQAISKLSGMLNAGAMNAAESLCVLGSTEAAKVLVDYVADDSRDSTKRAYALRQLILIGPAAVDAFRQLLKDRFVYTVKLMVESLGDLDFTHKSGSEFLKAVTVANSGVSSAFDLDTLRHQATSDPTNRTDAIDTLTLLGDFAALSTLAAMRDQFRKEAIRDSTRQTGLTGWQVYGDFIAAVDRMVQHKAIRESGN